MPQIMFSYLVLANKIDCFYFLIKINKKQEEKEEETNNIKH